MGPPHCRLAQLAKNIDHVPEAQLAQTHVPFEDERVTLRQAVHDKVGAGQMQQLKSIVPDIPEWGKQGNKGMLLASDSMQMESIVYCPAGRMFEQNKRGPYEKARARIRVVFCARANACACVSASVHKHIKPNPATQFNTDPGFL